MVNIPISSIIMPGFQRDRKTAQIEKIKAEFDGTACAFPLIAQFLDEYLALDGQQRVTACELLGMDNITVLLVEGVRTKERLAQIYLRVNRDRKLLNAFEKYIGALSSKDHGTVEIERLVRSFNREIGKSATAGGKIPAGAAVSIHTSGGNDLLERVLLVTEMAWGATPCVEANEGKTLLGIATFLKRHGEKVDDERLIGILSRHHPQYLLTQASAPRGPSYAEQLLDLYNKGLRGQKKL